MSHNLTSAFNAARTRARREPTNWTIVQMHEGMKLPCGCEIHTANGHDWTVRHWRDTCTAVWIKWNVDETQRIVRVGDGIHVSGCIVSEQDKIFASCNPIAGLWPHELEDVLA